MSPRNLGLVGGMLLVGGGILAYVYISNRSGVDIIRHGDSAGTIRGHVDKPCGAPPTNITSNDEKQFKASISAALKDAQKTGSFDVNLEKNLRQQLQSVSTTSDLANDLALIDYSTCTICLSLALSPQECNDARDKSQKIYADLKKR